MEAFVRVVDAGIILWCGHAVAPGPTTVAVFQDNCATRGASGCAPITPFYPWVDTDRGGRNFYEREAGPSRKRTKPRSLRVVGDDHPCCAGLPQGVCFFHAGGAVNRR